MQHRQSGFPDPDDSPAHDPSSPGPASRFGGGPGGDTFASMPGLDPGRPLGGRFAARLRAERGSVDVLEFTLDRQVLVIGRRLTSDVVVHDTNVSRQHARLLRGADGYAIEDTQSSNGTFVNDERVFGPRPLHSGDVIRIGDAVLVYEVTSGSEAPAAGSGPADWTRALPDVDLLESEDPAHERPTAGAAASSNAPTESPDIGYDPAAYAAAPADLSAAELEGELARREAEAAPATQVGEPGQVSAPGAPVADAGSATGTALADVGRDLVALAETANRLVERVRMLEAALDDRPRRPREPGRPSSDDTVALVELSRLLRDLQAFGDPEAATAAANLLDELSRQPRDVELLLSISRQAPIMAVVMRQHAYLMRLAPLLDEALGRMLD